VEGLERRLPAAGLARLLAAAARLALLEPADTQALLRRLMTVASPMRPPPLDTLATLCQGLYLVNWLPCGADLWQLTAWLAQAEGVTRTPPQAAALRHFALALLADRERRLDVECLPAESRRALAEALRPAPAAHRPPASDTTLKFRHEVAETLRRAGRAYDLDLILGPGIGVELALLGPDGALWLLDGPEAFHRPFADACEGELRLVPAEQRRSELAARLLAEGAAEEMTEALARWGSAAAVAPRCFAGASTAALGSRRLARMHWLDWAEFSPAARLAALANARPRLASLHGEAAT